MGKRINNLSARLAVNSWLVENGYEPISADASYEQFATKLRAIVAPTLAQVAFASRADAVAYIRHFAKSHVFKDQEKRGKT